MVYGMFTMLGFKLCCEIYCDGHGRYELMEDCGVSNAEYLVHSVEQLTVFYISGLVLALSSILSESSTSASGAKKLCKLCVNLYISIVNLLRTYIHT